MGAWGTSRATGPAGSRRTAPEVAPIGVPSTGLAILKVGFDTRQGVKAVLVEPFVLLDRWTRGVR